ncbi:N-acetylmuramoyl-L-alanine amidase family protein [Natranaerobius thermophilus]|uniref:Cell wall hydrolase/autolysin n=1 Tax=Natranaerobius thermophilus (strain ATCC BAA-1301 / DSM 18059 / JW/NM-WN-LF) TaxID=457570 RepID=B2A878_NATTJ|nr:N-acetylmuramoyl-L-alanine amidase [Natranaerobius thermophilus]ACB84444.1 cell wall hydrolase/autolysin [Natranaerobius thermophilus JW/NM-WN-LF]
MKIIKLSVSLLVFIMLFSVTGPIVGNNVSAQELEEISSTYASTVDTNEKPLEGVTILLDPGHGGWDAGAVGPTGLTEKEVALDVSLLTEDKLESLGADVHLTRYSDVDVSLYRRAAMANEVGADLFISVHANGAINTAAQGTETYYSSFRNPNDYYLAESLQEGMVNNMGRPDRGVLNQDFLVLRASNVPSAVVELAFLSNYEEEQLLRDDDFKDKAAQGITEGILNYLGE